MVATIVVIVLISVVGISVLAYRNRAERGIESGITSFRRELRALAPESNQPPRAARPAPDPPRTSGVGIVRPDPAPEPPPEAANEHEDDLDRGDQPGEDR